MIQTWLSIVGAILGIALFFYFIHKHDKKVMDALPVKIIGDAGSGLFHTLDCDAVKDILPENRKPLKLTKEIYQYRLQPCPICHPDSTQLYGVNNKIQIK